MIAPTVDAKQVDPKQIRKAAAAGPPGRGPVPATGTAASAAGAAATPADARVAARVDPAGQVVATPAGLQVPGAAHPAGNAAAAATDVRVAAPATPTDLQVAGAVNPAISVPAAPVTAVTAAVAPAAPAAALPAAPMGSQLAGRILPLRDAGDGVHRLTAHVHPADLGPVQIVAELRAGAIHLHLSGASDAAREALRAALPDLRRELEEAGLSPGGLDVGLNGQSAGPDGRGQDTAPAATDARSDRERADGGARAQPGQPVEVPRHSPYVLDITL